MAPVTRPPQTRYVTVGDGDVAYQVLGQGPPDLAVFFGIGSHLELLWDWAGPFFRRLAGFSRLILFDRRGTGMSDPVPLNAVPTWEEATEDLRAVLDAVGSERAAVYAEGDAGPIAILFAAIHPERVSSLVLGNTSSRLLVDDDYPIGLPQADVESVIDLISANWGSPDLARALAPDLSGDDELMELVSRQYRSAFTPRAAAALWRNLLMGVDVRRALPLVQAPTLILQATESAIVPLSHGRYLAEHIADATLVERPGAATGLAPVSFAETPDQIAQFLTGTGSPAPVDRVLTTVLFSDIVGSTTRLSDVGDEAWSRLLDTHDRLMREQLRAHRGKEINTTGDGFVASFEGPARAIRCAQAMHDATTPLEIAVRIGIHCGECEVRGDDLSGLAVHIAARVGALAESGQVLVSGTVKDLVAGSGIEFDDRGEHDLKGVPGSWRLFSVRS